eukprot:TRINITY_DN9954_c0_g1_i7.p1 TRINITY_DN9954_c0_g1~~TRINITY_DN9954_c0_g1_i7.p1  ORF type:complete len:556 (+),score=106.50 TRINITY_DN9954_c0_g1_i7:169-1836(+)
MAALSDVAPASPAALGTTPPPHRSFARCRLVTDAYDMQGQVGKGQFGAVFKGRCRSTDKIMALKKVLMAHEQEGFPLTALREIKLMSQLAHPNILGLQEVVHSQATEGNRLLGDIYLVFEYMDYDLGGLLNKGIEFTLKEIKCLSRQLLEGLFELKLRGVLHRDLKVANLLLNRDGVLKIADFGLARFTREPKKSDDKAAKDHGYTGTVCTRWYRPPELLLGEKQYSYPVDMWSAGCIIAELFTGSPILQGGVRDAQTERDNDIDQFLEICKLLGSPEAWQGHDQLRHAPVVLPKLTFPNRKADMLTKMLKRHQSPASVDLIAKILVWDPAQRLTAADALNHDVFWKEEPLPCKPNEIRKFETGVHDSTTRAVAKRNLRHPKTRAEAKAQAEVYSKPGPLRPPSHQHHQRGHGHAPPPPRRAPQQPSQSNRHAPAGAPPRRGPQAPSNSHRNHGQHRPSTSSRPSGSTAPPDARRSSHNHGRTVPPGGPTIRKPSDGRPRGPQPSSSRAANGQRPPSGHDHSGGNTNTARPLHGKTIANNNGAGGPPSKRPKPGS